MSIISNLRISRPYRSFWSGVLACFVVFVLFNGVLVKSANASNNYIENIQFIKDSNGEAILQFKVKTTFQITLGGRTTQVDRYVCDIGNFYFAKNQSGNYLGIVPITKEGNHYIPLASCNSTFTYTAGQIYSNFMTGAYNMSYDKTNGYLCSSFLTNCGGQGSWNGAYSYIKTVDGTLTSDDYLWTFGKSLYEPSQWPMYDTEKYYFQELPTLTITYPLNNDEIANLFTIQGTFTQPLGQEASFLQVETMPAGTFSSSLHSFWQAINEATSGVASIEIGDLPAGYYDFRIYFRGGAFDFYQGALISNIHIVNDLPQLIPSWQQQPPSTAPSVYQPLEPTTYYTENSTYATSSAMYNTLTGTFAPVLLSVGQNLTDFATRFSQSNASSTGNQLGASIVIVRSYIQNIISFFMVFLYHKSCCFI